MNEPPLPDLTDFRGIARLFPLPNVVLFPQGVLPLHIFEERYRHMTADALASDSLITMVLLQDGWEPDYQGNPPIHEIGCIGSILASKRRVDGRYDLLLIGLRRVRIQAELPMGTLYRNARVEILEEHAPDPASAVAVKLRTRLKEAVEVQFRELSWELDSDTTETLDTWTVGEMADWIAFMLPLAVAQKQALLNELDVVRRCERLLEHLQLSAPKPKARPFPPSFSAN